MEGLMLDTVSGKRGTVEMHQVFDPYNTNPTAQVPVFVTEEEEQILVYGTTPLDLIPYEEEDDTDDSTSNSASDSGDGDAGQAVNAPLPQIVPAYVPQQVAVVAPLLDRAQLEALPGTMMGNMSMCCNSHPRMLRTRRGTHSWFCARCFLKWRTRNQVVCSVDMKNTLYGGQRER